MVRLSVTERRVLLAASALRVIGQRGLSQATTRAIVAEAGMSLASFHYAYRSRDELLTEVMQRVVDGEMEAASLSLKPGSDIRDSVLDGIHAFFEYVRADPEHERALQELLQYALVTPGLDHLARAQYESYHRAATELLSSAALAAGVTWKDPLADVARFVVTITDGITLAWLADRDTAAAERTIELAATAIARLAEPELMPTTIRSGRA
ncbi:AcrR family transcriptional regulator [Salinibacterium sp. CAN_S4]|uniref:TetR/AcrR family transcriptional regulator n=1 Tax=Salinibacterium sp. CAN_S4 TaxID=2787727 RepID=UPI0018EF92D0